ncbi:MAG: TIR protein [uncultured Sulfurovum sp.]|uniref:TIR protein n=1 Tax=uncultured Sulfurovum sp. TaxID=269237 RepID=A0A6S6SDF3_9BACT|nr:MAG: TIR protein [uncultured Sulfurovum sp.]
MTLFLYNSSVYGNTKGGGYLMTKSSHNPVVLITNSQDDSFGTGFVIRKERNYSYIVTCAHVVEDTPKTLLVDSVNAKIIYIGSSNGLDLAVLKAQIDREPLPLLEGDCNEFEIRGYKTFIYKNNDYIYKPISCRLDAKVTFRPTPSKSIAGWELDIDDNHTLEKGYSGSPLICKTSSKVLGVISTKKGTQDGFAISIENLKTIWKDIPRNLIKKQNYIPKVFISSAHREPDISLARSFVKELNILGYKTFLAKTDITMGEDWLGRIKNELLDCEYFLLLLSENSLKSEMVLEEVKIIKELQNGSDFPVILPVRVNLPFDKNINYELLKQIDKIQQLIWKSEEDTEKIVEIVSNTIADEKALEKSTETLVLQDTDVPVPNAPLILEQPTGTVPLDSQNYIERKDDAKCYANLCDKYSLIRIKAPRQYGKTSLLARLIVKANEQNYSVVSFNFQEFDISLLSDLEELLEYIYETIADELDIEVKINKKILKKLTPMTKATKFMQKLLSQLDKPLVLAIDEADRLFEYADVSDSFFGLIRAWHEKAKQDVNWENLKILLSHSTEPLLGITSINQSPFHNVGLGIELQAFNKDEVKELAERHSLVLSDYELNEFMSFIGGHPFLSRKVLFTMVDEKQSFSQIVSNAYKEGSIFSDHMRRYLWILKENKKLVELLQSILNGESCNEDASCYILEATGLIKNVLNKPIFSCELYREFFSKNL